MNNSATWFRHIFAGSQSVVVGAEVDAMSVMSPKKDRSGRRRHPCHHCVISFEDSTATVVDGMALGRILDPRAGETAQ
jgi:hypothetical protein